ncbi:MAG: DUF6046 domain-containing protein [Bacteroidales bacterium]|jgi:hypothetical protein|nr:DUF6046 domain-containing protein [Bacteroidales bacterium]
MSTINIYFNKETRYIGANATNQALQMGVTAASGAIRRGLYATALTSLPGIDVQPTDNYRDRLRTEGSQIDNNVILETQSGDARIEFFDAKISVSKQNEIKTTQLVNRAGSVKELIQAKDYGVRISGSLIAERDKFPYETLELLGRILSEESTLMCSNPYLDLFGIGRLAFRSADFNQESAMYFNVMPFVLTFDSDMGYEFLVE